jgi:hypothetical protein
MKAKLLITLFTVTLFVATSCEKEEIEKKYPIEGLWIGTYTINEIPQQGALYYSFIIKPGGSLLTEGKGGDGKTYYATGSWTLTDTLFSFTYTTPDAFNNPVTATGTATYHKTGKLTNGIWHNITKPNISGTFPVMDRVN